MADCRFCCIRKATVRLPTAFGMAELCMTCVERYRRYLRRPKRKTGGPAKTTRPITPSPRSSYVQHCIDRGEQRSKGD